jgi:hypothetical protein
LDNLRIIEVLVLFIIKTNRGNILISYPNIFGTEYIIYGRIHRSWR